MMPSEMPNNAASPASSATPSVVMSAMRATGRLHLGHYFGVLTNWVRLQQTHSCYFHIADLHSLTTKYDQTENLPHYCLEMALDWLAAGVDPLKATLYVQSWVPEITELHLLLSMMTPNKWVETDPTLKDMVAMMRGVSSSGSADAETPSAGSTGEELTYGLLGYPVLQTADILSVKGQQVPVGKDQLAHLEISRDIARRFNHVVGQAVFPEPRPLLTEIPLLPGLDGRKMGKSYNNAIFLSDTEDETWAKLKGAITDPARVRKQDAGSPEQCVAVFPWYQMLASQQAQDKTRDACEKAERGCMDCKKQLAEIVNESLRPIRERRQTYANDKQAVLQILTEGSQKARAVCQQTLAETKRALNLWVP
jgi:tryptophanyl-tRNA synthetase